LSSDPRQAFQLDRRAVVQAFDRASGSYDAAAALQERVRNELVARLVELKIEPARILDLGAGTGHASRALKRRYPKSLTVAADIAPGMLMRAKAQSRWLRLQSAAQPARQIQTLPRVVKLRRARCASSGRDARPRS